MNDFLVQVCILILLPIIPAGLMFQLFRSRGKGEGDFFGFKWSFGGAFAGYLIILLILWSVMQKQMQPKEAEVWTVRGQIGTGEIKDLANRIQIKSIPQSLRLEDDGEYEFKVIVLKKDDNLEFPRVKIDLTRLCGGVKTVQLNDSKGTFRTFPSAKSVDIEKDLATRSIKVAAITLPETSTNELCGQDF